AHVLGFVAADLPVLAALGRQLFAESALRPRTRLAKQAVGLHVPPHGAIRPQWSHGWLGLDRLSEVILVQLVGPVLVVVVLPPQMLDLLCGQRHLAAVLAHRAPQDAHGVVLLTPRCVVPTLDGGDRETHLASAHWMRPGLLGQQAQGDLEFSWRRGRAQQRAHYGEAEACPQGCGRWIRFLGHHVSSKKGKGVKNDCQTHTYPGPPGPSRSVFCGWARISGKPRLLGP